MQCRMTQATFVPKTSDHGNYSTLPCIQDCTGAPRSPYAPEGDMDWAVIRLDGSPFSLAQCVAGSFPGAAPAAFHKSSCCWLPLSPRQPQFLCRVLDRALLVTSVLHCGGSDAAAFDLFFNRCHNVCTCGLRAAHAGSPRPCRCTRTRWPRRSTRTRWPGRPSGPAGASWGTWC